MLRPRRMARTLPGVSPGGPCRYDADMNRTWAKLGGQLGLGCIGIGILIIALAWNGAAGIDFVSGQIPYLLSGGALGVALCIVGGVLIVVQNSRRDRALLEAQLRDL